MLSNKQLAAKLKMPGYERINVGNRRNIRHLARGLRRRSFGEFCSDCKNWALRRLIALADVLGQVK
jgi:predicted flavoprotein YhiN